MKKALMFMVAVAAIAGNSIAAEAKTAAVKTAEKTAEKNPYLGVWRSGSRSDGYTMAITDGGRGLVFAYIGAFPLRWDAVSNGVVRVLCPQGHGCFGKMMFRYDKENDRLERFENIFVDLADGKASSPEKEAGDAVTTFARVKVPKEHEAKMKLEVEQYLKAYGKKAAADDDDCDAVDDEEDESAKVVKKEFELSEKSGVKGLVACLESGGNFFLECVSSTNNGISVYRVCTVGGKDLGLVANMFSGEYVYGEDKLTDPRDARMTDGQYVEKVPQSARVVRKGCDKKFVSRMSELLKSEGVDVMPEVYCYLKTYYAKFYDEVRVDFKKSSADAAVAAVVKAMRTACDGKIRAITWHCASTKK